MERQHMSGTDHRIALLEGVASQVARNFEFSALSDFSSLIERIGKNKVRDLATFLKKASKLSEQCLQKR